MKTLLALFLLGIPVLSADLTATYVDGSSMQDAFKKAPPDSVTDQGMGVFDLGKFNLGVSAVYRGEKAEETSVTHDSVTEIYHILEGSGVLMTGGALVNAQRQPADNPTVKNLTGPSIRGTALKDGESRRVGPGDVVIIPPHVGHWFSSIDSSIRYLVIRVDPDKLLPAK